MKKGLKILLYALLQIFVLTACASKSEDHAAASDTTASDTDETSVPISAKTKEETTKQEDTKPEDTESQKEDTLIFYDFLRKRNGTFRMN